MSYTPKKRESCQNSTRLNLYYFLYTLAPPPMNSRQQHLPLTFGKDPISCHHNAAIYQPPVIQQMLMQYEYHTLSYLGVGISESCFVFYLASLPLEVTWPI